MAAALAKLEPRGASRSPKRYSVVLALAIATTLAAILPLPLLFPLFRITLVTIARPLVDLSFGLVRLNRVVMNCRGRRAALAVSSACGQRQREGDQQDEKYDRGLPDLTCLPARLELETITKYRDAGFSAAAGGLECGERSAARSTRPPGFPDEILVRARAVRLVA